MEVLFHISSQRMLEIWPVLGAIYLIFWPVLAFLGSFGEKLKEHGISHFSHLGELCSFLYLLVFLSKFLNSLRLLLLFSWQPHICAGFLSMNVSGMFCVNAISAIDLSLSLLYPCTLLQQGYQGYPWSLGENLQLAGLYLDWPIPLSQMTNPSLPQSLKLLH